jgi:hypothetical protein
MSPAMIFLLIEKMKMTPKTPIFRIPYEIGVFGVALLVFLPASISIFPQTGILKVNEIEMELQRDNINTIYYNKGL